MGVLTELGVTEPVPAFNAPAVSHQLQQGFWRGAQARQKQVGGLKRPAVTSASGRDFHDPAGADPGFADVLWSLFGAQRPGDVAAVANLVNVRHERNVPLSLELRSVTATKDDAPAPVQAAIHNVAGLGSSSIGGGLIQTTSG